MGIASAVWKPVSGPSAVPGSAGGQPTVHTESTQSAKLSDITDLRVAIILIKLFKTKSIIDSFLNGTEAVDAVDRGRVHHLHCESGNVRR